MGVKFPQWAPEHASYLIELPDMAGAPVTRLFCGSRSDAQHSVDRLLAGTKPMFHLEPGERPTWIRVWLKQRDQERELVDTFILTNEEIELEFTKILLQSM